MRSYPVNMLLKSKPCAVVGGGEVAARKIRGLLDAGAKVTVISPEICPQVEELARKHNGAHEPSVSIIRREYNPSDLAGMTIVIAATGDKRINSKIAMDARAVGAMVNVVDQPDECDFFMPATLRRGDVTVAVGTGGSSPNLAAYLRDEIAGNIGPEYGELARLMGEARKKTYSDNPMGARPYNSSGFQRDLPVSFACKQSGGEAEALPSQAEIFERLLESGIIECIKKGDYSAAGRIIKKIAGVKIDMAMMEKEE